MQKLNSFLEVLRRVLEERAERLFENGGVTLEDTLDCIIKEEHIS